MRAIRHDVIAALAVLACAAGAHSGSVLRATGLQPDDEQLIREARARSNQAIAAHDLAAIARVWMEDVYVVSSTSAQTAGREPNQQRLARQFTNRPDTIYVRRPTVIDVRLVGSGLGTRRVDWAVDGARRRARDRRDLLGAMAQGPWTVARLGRALRSHALYGRAVLPPASSVAVRPWLEHRRMAGI